MFILGKGPVVDGRNKGSFSKNGISFSGLSTNGSRFLLEALAVLFLDLLDRHDAA